MSRPNILLIMTDEERYPPPYESAEVTRFRKEQLPARESLRAGGLQLHRHYAGSTACLPSRATLFTGQYPSLHGASQTGSTGKEEHGSFDAVAGPLTRTPTLGGTVPAGGYKTHYRGKWHISHADLLIPGSHDSLAASDDDGRAIVENVDAYKKADRLDPFGFSGWIGREPHGAKKSDSGVVRDGVFAEQVIELFDELGRARSDGPWLAVASFVNPHDISFSSFGSAEILGLTLLMTPCLTFPRHLRSRDSFAGRPACQEQFLEIRPQAAIDQPPDVGYRRLYYYLHKLVDRAIGRILEALDQSGLAEDTIIVFTSDHGTPSAPMVACNRSGTTHSMRRSASLSSFEVPVSRQPPPE